ncbi:hypothetical protein DFH07DRAFT_844896 [Mycena maculata]|uniref:Uncharacterized protein n=1 Tax=Mycena maculata TaxID=230809 RepID=A0AAD7I3T3_9AGAR|nr:hypothetical protein DFH07DRAFT_844896 [Mycena maculata]
MSASALAPAFDSSTFAPANSDGQAHPRPLKAPPLNTVPSTPGPEFPGGYPRNSVVFATNKWDHADQQKDNTQGSSLLATAKTYVAAPAAYLPSAVTSYFPDVSVSNASSSSSTDSDTDTTPNADGSPNTVGVHTPYPRAGPPLNTDGSMSVASDFSTRAYAGSGSSRGLTSVQSDFPASSAASDSDTYTMSDARAQQHPYAGNASSPPSSETAPPAVSEPPATADVTPLPSVAPFATLLASNTKPHPAPTTTPPGQTASPSPIPPAYPSTPSGSGSNASGPSTPPSSPGSPKKLGSGFFATLRRGKAAAPPSSFGAGAGARGSLDSSDPNSTSTAPATTGTTNGNGHARGASLDSGSPSTNANAQTSARKPSLLRTLRGEAKVLNGKMRRDPGRVEAGRRMLSGTA